MQRHAYLIIANRNPIQLQKLLYMIDDSRNDIYLLIDKKSKMITYKFYTRFSIINYVKPINIYWGDYSQIKAEMSLFKAALRGHYKYYHLLSGLDLPLANQDIIHNFFDEHPNKEFLTYGNPKNLRLIDLRLKHHLFRHHYRTLPVKFFNKFEKIILMLIPQYKIQRQCIGYASNWVSIDDDLIHLLIKSSSIIHYLFQYGYLVDELFIPTILNLYPAFLNRVYYRQPVHDKPSDFQGNLRYINWWDGSPYIWKFKDFNKLMKARKKGYLFSRKFDDKIDNRIINKIFNVVMKS